MSIARTYSVAPTFDAVVDWRADLVDSLGRGDRIVTLFGRPDGDDALLTAVLQGPDGGLRVSRVRVDPTTGYHTLTEQFPALHCFERELHEQLNLRVAGHPWLKPVRFGRGTPTSPDDYPFYTIQSKQTHEVQVGPIHAATIEPGAFRFSCEGEEVDFLEIHHGFQHRGVESLLLEREPRSLAPLVEIIAGDSSIAHTWAYAAAVEALAGGEAAAGREDPPERDVARAVLLELERIAMHLAGLSGMSSDIGFLQGGATYGRLRTTAINSTMRLCGSRFGRTAVRPGGSGATLDTERRRKLRANLALLTRDGALIDDRFTTSASVNHRLATTGRVSTAAALELGLVGMVARASGVSLDQRARQPALWEGLPVETRLAGDCHARAALRIAEVRASIRFIEGALERVPEWLPERGELGAFTPDRLVISVVEGWRGEVVHCLETDADGTLIHYKVQDPSFRNWMGLAVAVRGNEISDFPICNKSFDLSYCGNDL